jgi:hypothetical protein
MMQCSKNWGFANISRRNVFASLSSVRSEKPWYPSIRTGTSESTQTETPVKTRFPHKPP